jgi:hypothetical protein
MAGAGAQRTGGTALGAMVCPVCRASFGDEPAFDAHFMGAHPERVPRGV